MLSIIGFLIMLAPLVIVHELGHFLFAKLFNVKAEAFSIGFGPRWKPASSAAAGSEANCRAA